MPVYIGFSLTTVLTRRLAEAVGIEREPCPRRKTRRRGCSPAPPLRRDALEVEADFGRQRARRDVMRAAESGEEIVHGDFVRDIDRREPETPLVSVAAKQIVFADTRIEEAARRNAGRIVVVIFRVWRGNL